MYNRRWRKYLAGVTALSVALIPLQISTASEGIDDFAFSESEISMVETAPAEASTETQEEALSSDFEGDDFLSDEQFYENEEMSGSVIAQKQESGEETVKETVKEAEVYPALFSGEMQITSGVDRESSSFYTYTADVSGKVWIGPFYRMALYTMDENGALNFVQEYRGNAQFTLAAGQTAYLKFYGNRLRCKNTTEVDRDILSWREEGYFGNEFWLLEREALNTEFAGADLLEEQSSWNIQLRRLPEIAEAQLLAERTNFTANEDVGIVYGWKLKLRYHALLDVGQGAEIEVPEEELLLDETGRMETASGYVLHAVIVSAENKDGQQLDPYGSLNAGDYEVQIKDAQGEILARQEISVVPLTEERPEEETGKPAGENNAEASDFVSENIENTDGVEDTENTLTEETPETEVEPTGVRLISGETSFLAELDYNYTDGWQIEVQYSDGSNQNILFEENVPISLLNGEEISVAVREHTEDEQKTEEMQIEVQTPANEAAPEDSESNEADAISESIEDSENNDLGETGGINENNPEIFETELAADEVVLEDGITEDEHSGNLISVQEVLAPGEYEVVFLRQNQTEIGSIGIQTHSLLESELQQVEEGNNHIACGEGKAHRKFYEFLPGADALYSLGDAAEYSVYYYEEEKLCQLMPEEGAISNYRFKADVMYYIGVNKEN